MPTVAALERRLRVGGELLSIVGTMKGLAAASIHEFEVAVHALREYIRTIELGLQMALSGRPDLVPSHPADGGRVGAIIIGTDQGLCGPINREMAQVASRWLADHSAPDEDRWVVALGVRMTRELQAAGVGVDQELPLPTSVEAVAPQVEKLIIEIDRWRRHDGVNRVMVFHQHPLQRTRRNARTHQVVPPDIHRLESIAARPWPTRMRPGTPHDWEEVLSSLLRQDLLIALYRAIAEAKAAEHGARLSAMQAAEQNIRERLDRLRNRYNQLRQAQITAELLDVVSGFEVLREE